MSTTMLIWIVVGLYLCGLSFGINTKATERIELRNRLVLDNKLPNTETPDSLVDCFRLCTKNKACMSISYQQGTGACNLYSGLTENDLGIYADGWNTYLFGDLKSDKDDTSESYPGTTEGNLKETTSSDIGDTTQSNTAGPCPTSSGYFYSSGLDFCYKIHFGNYNHSQAVAGCSAEASTLIRINSADKLSEVADKLYTTHMTGSSYAYIQGTRDGTSIWYFDDGTQITYEKWGPWQPDNLIGFKIDYLAMKADSNEGYCHDVHDDFDISYICEKSVSNG